MEGDEVVPAIAGAFLFTEGTDRSRAVRLGGGLYGGGGARERPLFASSPAHEKSRGSYDLESLGLALRDGAGPTGRRLAASMPRYALSDLDLEALAAYLASIDLAPAEGVTDTTIRFATIVVGDGPRSRGVIDVLEAFVRDQRGQTRHDQHRAEKGPWFKQWQLGAYRDWDLEVWRLTGAPETWRAQLEASYRRAPVFAVLSGALGEAGAEASWAPIQAFCENERLPCVFPVTNDPGEIDGQFYTAYLAPGLELEAQVALGALKELVDAAETPEILQLAAPVGRAGAAEVERVVAVCGRDAAVFEAEADLLEALEEVDATERGPAVMIWTDAAEAMAMLGRRADLFARAGAIFLFDRLGEADLSATPPSLRDRVQVVRAFETRDPAARHLLRTTAWLRAKKVALGDVEAQASAFFATTTAAMALKRMRGLYSREYFLERIEHIVDNSLVMSIFPRLTMGPGQRVASHGAYVLSLDGEGGVERTDWLTPTKASCGR